MTSTSDRSITKQHNHRRKSSVETQTPSYKVPVLSSNSTTGPIKSLSNSVRSGSFKLRRGSDTALWTSNSPTIPFSKTNLKINSKSRSSSSSSSSGGGGGSGSTTNSPRSVTAPSESKLAKLSTSLFKITHSNSSPRSTTTESSKTPMFSNSTSKTVSSSSNASNANTSNTSRNTSKNSTPVTTSSSAYTPLNKYSAADSKQSFDSVKLWNEKCYLKYISINSPHQCNLPEEIRVKFDECYERGMVPTKPLIEEAKAHIYKTLHNLYQNWCIYATEHQHRHHLGQDSDNEISTSTSNDSSALVSTSSSDYSLTEGDASDRASVGGSDGDSDADSGSVFRVSDVCDQRSASSSSSSSSVQGFEDHDQSELENQEMFMFVNPMLNNTKDYSTSTCPSSRELTPDLTPDLTPNITPSLTPQHSLLEQALTAHTAVTHVPDIPDLSTMIDLSKIKDPASLNKTAPFLFQNLRKEKKNHGKKPSSHTLSKKLSHLSTTTSRSSTSTTASERTITAVKNMANTANITSSSNTNNSNNKTLKGNGAHSTQHHETSNANSINMVLSTRLQTPQMSMPSSSASSFYSF